MSTRRLFLSISAVFILIFLAHSLGFLTVLENLSRRVISPIAKTIYLIELKTKNFYAGLGNQQNIISENEQCQAKLRELYLDQTELALLREENRILRAESNFIKPEQKKIVAEIISKTTDGASNSIIINRGSNNGIAVGDPVFFENGFLLGRIINAETTSAIIRLITDNRSKITASIINQNKTQGLVEGEHGLSIKMKMIPQDENVQIDDIVITSGAENKIPRGLIIGKVESIQKELYEPFQSANLRPLADLDKAVIVTVITQQ
ncbi:MAG: rod shape-determining protein MreC [Candidatus Magasanikbacteria bacterium]|nr:rod shape-determining protein MreC [Candidatus Magasanikbacteria bacterium]